jgi:FkbM family methyltransferase
MRLGGLRAPRIKAGPALGLRISRSDASADYVRGVNELPVQVALADALEPGGTFFDVGANVGFFSILAARAVGTTGAVYCFEPVPTNASRIRWNARRNGFRNVHLLEVAASDESGSTTLLLAKHPGGAVIASAGAPPDPAGAIDVPTVTIDELVSAGRVRPPSVVKIDVEGAELAVLRGMLATLRQHRPVIVCEIDAPDEEALQAKRGEITQLLEAAGYDIERLGASYDSTEWLVEHLVGRPTRVAS